MDEQLVKATPKPSAPHKKGQEPRQELLDCLLLVIKASIHHFLFLRKIYPQRWFKSERIFLTYTKACRHPVVREYVSEAVSSIKEPLSCGQVHTVCVCVEMPGCAPHELLCIHPSVLLGKNAIAVPWEDVDGALRGFLLQMHNLQCAMPDAIKGATYHLSFQAETPSDVPKPTWALYEDPRQLAIEAAEASVLEAPEASPPAAYSGCEDHLGASPQAETLPAAPLKHIPKDNLPEESMEFAGSNQYSPKLTQSQSQNQHTSARNLLGGSAEAAVPAPHHSSQPGASSEQPHLHSSSHLVQDGSQNVGPARDSLPSPNERNDGKRAREAGAKQGTSQEKKSKSSKPSYGKASQNSGMLELLRSLDANGAAEQDSAGNDGTDSEILPAHSLENNNQNATRDAGAESPNKSPVLVGTSTQRGNSVPVALTQQNTECIVLDDSPEPQLRTTVTTGALGSPVATACIAGDSAWEEQIHTPTTPNHQTTRHTKVSNQEGANDGEHEGGSGDTTDLLKANLGSAGDESPDFFGVLMGSYDGFAQRPARAQFHSQEASDGARVSTGGSEGTQGSEHTHTKNSPAEAKPEQAAQEVAPPQVAPPDAAAGMVLRPLIDTHVKDVLWLRANVMYLQH